MSYNHVKIEQKWQNKWDKAQIFQAKNASQKPKFYVMDMFPYPSSSGLHVGHPEGYTASDIVARYKRCKGYNVLHPIGFDAFGLPAEQYAIQTGIHPAITTQKAIDNFQRQLKSLGFSFDWSRKISTCDPSYYKWTQYIFTLLLKKGLAYQKKVPVNWCPALKTVLANEEIIDGKSERGDHSVVQVPMTQWMLKITDYAEKLLTGLDDLDWPERTKEGQRHWIGKSTGAVIDFQIEGHERQKISVFTTRIDTLFGATFLVLSPEHPLLQKITATEYQQTVQDYMQKASNKSELARKTAQDKTGVFTGCYVLHPFTKKKLPVWISDYVLMSYGTGSIMAVPAHDQRDFEFAKKYHLDIQRVVEGGDQLPYMGEGRLIQSDFVSGVDSQKARNQLILKIEQRKIGKKHITYKLRDWLFSRQRYWGEPFPIIHYPDKEMVHVPKDDLPVLLPEVADYEPSDQGESPLARNKQWMNLSDGGQRETDTMPGSAGSSWYFLRYTDPHNDKEPFDFDCQKYWMPVDLYVGGPEHTVGHLLYARFWQRVLYDVGLVSHPEPFKKLVHQGMILGEDGEKMSKSAGNIINPDHVVEKYGADALRVYEMFMGPLDKDKPWQDKGISGVKRFLERVWRLCIDEQGQVITHKTEKESQDIQKLLHKTIKKVSEDIESLDLNTAISQMMILVKELYRTDQRPHCVLMTLIQLLAPFAPHIAEELWEKLGGEGFVSLASWPEFKADLVKSETVTIGIQVNGTMRGAIEVTPDESQEMAVQKACQLPRVQKAIDGRPLAKTIYIPGKILNILTI